MFSSKEEKIISQCIDAGLGCALFALSVRKQGWCSERQYLTMHRMLGTIEYRKNNPPSWSSRQTNLDCAFSDECETP
jgi:hypothetical protein